jgi:hypothetical protein
LLRYAKQRTVGYLGNETTLSNDTFLVICMFNNGILDINEHNELIKLFSNKPLIYVFLIIDGIKLETVKIKVLYINIGLEMYSFHVNSS